MTWLASGRVVNPTLDLVLVDSGALVAGSYFFTVYGASTVASAWEVQHRNALNTANIKSQIIAVGSMGASEPFTLPDRIVLELAASERIRIVQVAAVTGSVSVSLVGNF